jgi:ABC-type spermidine/putrescine transport system permease subunit I
MNMWQYTLTVFVFGAPCVTVLLVFAMRYVAKVHEARARLANDGAYRDLAEKAVTLESQATSLMSAVQTELAAIATRLTAVEKILKEVE